MHPNVLRPGRRAAFAVVAAATLAALVAGCGRNNTRVVEPIPVSVPPPPGVVVAGTVSLQSGHDKAGIVVTLEPVANGVTASVRRAIDDAKAGRAVAPLAGGTPRAAGVRATVTDGNGRFAFAGVAEGDYAVGASTKNYLGGNATIRVPNAVTADTTYVNIALTPTGTFTGTTTLETASNHASTVVYVSGSSNAAVTDAAGNWTMRNVPIGNKTLIGTHSGWLDKSVAGALGFAGDSVGITSFQLTMDRNMSPIATAGASGSCSSSPFNMTGSGTDADGSISLYEWDFEDDGTVDYSSPSTGNTTHVFPAGSHRAKFIVHDDKNAIGITVVNLTAIAPDTIYVSTTTGNDGNPGSAVAPLKTLAAGLTAAAALAGGPCTPVLAVSNATYNETVTIPGGISMVGGFDPTTWTPLPGIYTVVIGVGSPALVDNVSSSLSVSRFDFRATSPAGLGASTYGITVRNSSGFVAFNTCKFMAGNGTAGAAGNAGTAVLNGNGGSGGGAGQSNSMTGGTAGPGGTGVNPGGSGGTGGYGGGGANGASGSGSCPAPGGNGGSYAGACFALSGSGATGTPGCNGSGGATGTAASGIGTASAGGYSTANGGNGIAGTYGTGGGGGGGGGGGYTNFPCSGDRAGGGGGGGAGGPGGNPGGGGVGGGASIGAYVYSSAPKFTSCMFTSGNGGNGGKGGNAVVGGVGGPGGPGGAAADDSGAGGNGGKGGDGGAGGPGAGGTGGPSIGLWFVNSPSASHTASTMTTGSGGLGGVGGTNPVGGIAPSGANGASQSVRIN